MWLRCTPPVASHPRGGKHFGDGECFAADTNVSEKHASRF